MIELKSGFINQRKKKYGDLKCSLAEIQLASVSFVDGNCWNSAHHLESEADKGTRAADRSMEVQLSTLLENEDRMTD